MIGCYHYPVRDILWIRSVFGLARDINVSLTGVGDICLVYQMDINVSPETYQVGGARFVFLTESVVTTLELQVYSS